MSSSAPEAVIECAGVGKDYELGELASLQRSIATVKRVVRRQPAVRSTIRALAEVTFSVAQGESFAILGRNGSGKTTLVSLISGVSVPTAGIIRIRGTVMPLLSVGAGFNPELTGNENVALFGSMLGLSRDTIDAALPEIADFAEIKPAHMLTPTKRYSAGMRARLSFATALRLPADVYILDEVLATADDEFKAKAADHLEDLRDAGASIIFISHELPLLERICHRGVWLEEGRIHRTGTIPELAPAYTEHLAAASDAKRKARTGLRPAKPVRRLRVSGRGT